MVIPSERINIFEGFVVYNKGMFVGKNPKGEYVSFKSLMYASIFKSIDDLSKELTRSSFLNDMHKTGTVVMIRKRIITSYSILKENVNNEI